MRTVHLLINPAARRGSADGAAVRQGLADRGLRVESIEPDGPDDVAAAIGRAAPEHVVAVGGDGLIHRALPALVGADVGLGVVPSGTGNDLARALGLPTKRAAAIERAIGQTTPIDLLRVEHADGSISFAHSVVTAGFSGNVNATANERTFPGGSLKYTAASLTELRRLDAVVVDGAVTTPDGNEIRLAERCAFFAVANTRYFGGGMAIAPAAEAADGMLHVVTVAEVPAWQLALVLPTVFVGQHVRHPAVTQLSGHRVAIAHDHDVWADGERIGAGAIAVSVVPSALMVAAS